MQEDYLFESERASYFDVVLVIIIVLTTSFSAYTTYLGFSFDIPALLALFLSVVIGLALLAINLKIRDARRKDLGLGGPLAAFAIVFIVSFISNTNAIYTFFVQRDIVGQTQEVAWQVFDSQTNKILSAIADMPEVTAFADKDAALRTTRENLKKQIMDVRNPGFGEFAQAHFREINEILGVELTTLRPPAIGSEESQYAQFAEELDALILEQARIQFDKDPAAPIIGLRDDINKLRSFYEDKMIIKDYHPDTTDLMKRDLNSIAVAASDLLAPADLALEQIDNESDATGSFQYTWRNIIHWISPTAIILSMLLGALLDLLAPLLSILLYRHDEVL